MQSPICSELWSPLWLAKVISAVRLSAALSWNLPCPKKRGAMTQSNFCCKQKEREIWRNRIQPENGKRCSAPAAVDSAVYLNTNKLDLIWAPTDPSHPLFRLKSESSIAEMNGRIGRTARVVLVVHYNTPRSHYGYQQGSHRRSEC